MRQHDRRWFVLLMLCLVVSTFWIAALLSRLRNAEAQVPDQERKLRECKAEINRLRGRLSGFQRPPSEVPRTGEPSLSESPSLAEPINSLPDPKKRTRTAFEAYFAAEDLQARKRLQHELFLLVGNSAECHAELMLLLSEAREEGRIQEILGFLLWNGFAGNIREDRVTRDIHSLARRVAGEPGPLERRIAAIQVLLQYLDPSRDSRANAGAVVDLWKREPAPEARERIFEELLSVGPYPLPQADTEDILGELRRRLQRGDETSAGFLSAWSRSEGDFRIIAGLLRDSPDPQVRMRLLDSLKRNQAITEGRERDAKALLADVMFNPSENDALRNMAYDFLRNSWLPWDRQTEDWLKEYEGRKR
jgi:hypothetical protein